MAGSRSLGVLTLDVVAKIGGFSSGMDAAERRSKRAADKIAKDQKQAAEQVNKAFASLGRQIGGVFAAREIIQAADSYKLLSARLQLVSKDAKALAEAQSEIVRISNDNRVGIEQTAQLYTQLARSTQSLGISQKDLLGVTESISQALLVSGGSAESAKAALTQLSQAFAAGVLRGEEFNSVSEQAPRILQAIADGLGVSIGQLREMAKQGELTSERVIKALQSQAAVLAAEAKAIPLTIGQATTQAANAFSVFIGSIDESTGATEGLASALGETAKFVTELSVEIRKANQGAEDVGFLAEAFTIASQAVRVLFSDVVFVFKGVKLEIVTIAKQLYALGRLDLKNFTAISDAAKADAARARAELDRYQQQVLNPFLRSRGRGTTGFEDPRLIGATPPSETVGFRPSGGGAGVVDKNTIAGIQATIKALKEQRDKVAINSAEFKKLNAEIQAAEKQLQGLIGRDSGRSKERQSDAEKFIETLKGQLQSTKDLSVLEETIIELQNKKYATILPAQKEEILNLAKQIDLARQLKEEDAERWEIIKMRRADAIAEGEAVEKANEEYQRMIESIIDATPTKQLEKQRDVMKALADEYERGRFGAVGSQEAIKLYGEAVNQYLGNTEEKLKEQKSLAEELGMTFSSAFEDAIVSGKSFSDVLKGLGQDIMRIVTRKLVTEPLGNAIAGALGGSGGIGGFFSNIFGSIFGGGRATGGPVMPNRLYEVNEQGPEMLEMGGRQYLMMGDQAGRVIPTSQAKGGNNISVNVTAVPGMSRDTALQQGARIGSGIQLALTRNT